MGKVVWPEEEKASGTIHWPEGEATKEGIREDLTDFGKSMAKNVRTAGRYLGGVGTAIADFAAMIPEMPVLGGLTLGNLGVGGIEYLGHLTQQAFPGLKETPLVPESVYKPPERNYFNEMLESSDKVIREAMESGAPSTYLMGMESPEETWEGFADTSEILAIPAEHIGIPATKGLVGLATIGQAPFSEKTTSDLAGEVADWMEHPEKEPAVSAISEAAGTLFGYGLVGGLPRWARNKMRPQEMVRQINRPKQEPKVPTEEETQGLAPGDLYEVEGQKWRVRDPGDLKEKPEPRIGETDFALPEEQLMALRGRVEPRGVPDIKSLETPGERAARELRESEQKQGAERAREKAIKDWEKELLPEELRTKEGETKDMFREEDVRRKQVEEINKKRDELRSKIWARELEPKGRDEQGNPTGWKDKQGNEYTNEQVVDAFNQDLPFETLLPKKELEIIGGKREREAELRGEELKEEKPLTFTDEQGKRRKGKVVWEGKEKAITSREGKVPVSEREQFSIGLEIPRESIEYVPPRIENQITMMESDPRLRRLIPRMQEQAQLIGELNTRLGQLQQEIAQAKMSHKARSKLKEEYQQLSEKLSREQEYIDQMSAATRERAKEIESLYKVQPEIQKAIEYDLGPPSRESVGGIPADLLGEVTKTIDFNKIKAVEEVGQAFAEVRKPFDEKIIQHTLSAAQRGEPALSTLDYAVRNDFIGLLAHTQRTTKDPFYKALAEKLIKQKETKAVGVELVAGAAMEGSPYSTGVYHGKTNVIQFNPTGALQTSTILHEGVHAATLNKIYESNRPGSGYKHPSVGVLQDLFLYAKEHLGKAATDYGFTDLYEFVAEGFSDKAFQEKLRNIPVTKKQAEAWNLPTLAGRLHNAWTAFVHSVAKMLGLKPGDVNALSVLLNEGSKLIEAPSPYYRGQSPTAAISIRGTPKVRPQVGKGVVKSVKGLTILDKRPANEVVADAVESGLTRDIPTDKAGEILQGRDVGELFKKYNPYPKWFVSAISGIDRAYNVKTTEAIKGQQWIPGKRWNRRMRKDFTGATTFLRDWNQPKTSKDFVNNTLWYYDTIGKTPTRQELISRGHNQVEVQAIETIHQRLKDFATEYNQLASSLGFSPINLREGFMPHVRIGDYMVYAKDPQGNMIGAHPVENIYQAKTLSTELQQQFPNHVIEWNRRESRYDINDLTPYFEILSKLNSKSPDYQMMNQAVQNILTHRGFSKHSLFRGGVPGHLGPANYKDTITSLETYFEKGYRYLANQAKNKTFQDWYSALENHGINPQTRLPNTLKYMENYRENSTGSLKNYLQAVDNVLEFAGETTGRLNIGSPSTAKKSLSTLNGMASAAWLFTPKFMLVQAFQTAFTTPKMLEISRDLGINRTQVVTAYMHGWKETVSPSAEAKAAINYAKKQGYVESKIVDFMDTNLRDNKASKIAKTISQGAHWTIGKVEQESVRTSAFLMYDSLLRKHIKDNETRWDLAGELTDHTMVDYGKNEKPFMYQHLGMLGQAAAPLKTYPHSYFGHALNYLRQIKDEKDLAPFAMFIGVQAIMAGATGMLAVETVDQITQAINLMADTNLPTMDQYLIETNAGDLVTFGLVSTMTGLDVSKTLSAPSPEGFYSLPGIEFGGQAAQESFNYLRKSITGTATDADLMRMLQATTPTLAQGWIEEGFTQPGMGPPNPRNEMFPDLPKRTEGLLQPGGGYPYPSDEFARKGLGGRSLKEARDMKRIQIDKQQQQKLGKKRGELEDAIIESMIKRNTENTKDLIMRFHEAGGNAMQLESKLKTKLINRNLNWAQRRLRSLKITPKERARRYNLFKSQLERMNSEELINTVRETGQ